MCSQVERQVEQAHGPAAGSGEGAARVPVDGEKHGTRAVIRPADQTDVPTWTLCLASTIIHIAALEH
jgi:hypothetical protein